MFSNVCEYMFLGFFSDISEKNVILEETGRKTQTQTGDQGWRDVPAPGLFRDGPRLLPPGVDVLLRLFWILLHLHNRVVRQILAYDPKGIRQKLF